MPTQVSYPGVYIEEVPSGVRTIAGVSTSVTAFVGSAPRGPVNEPTTIHSFADYERTFGGLAVDSSMSYSVQDFFVNGGGEALVVRVHNGATSAAATLEAGADDLVLETASPGEWGDALTVEIEHVPGDADKFNLFVFEDGVQVERFLNLVVAPMSPRSVTRVLDSQSSYLRVQRDGSGNPQAGTTRPSLPAPGDPPITFTGGGPGGDVGNTQLEGTRGDKTGIYALEKADLFNLLCIPPPARGGPPVAFYGAALAYCKERRAVLIADSDPGWDKAAAQDAITTLGLDSANAAVYYPWLRKRDPLLDYQVDDFPPSGAVAGVIARTDATRGVWKAPAGTDATITGAVGVTVPLTDAENGDLNPLGVNVLRSFPVFGNVVWGARTARGADQLADEYKYLPVRRTALFIEESLYRGTQWVVFEPNDEPLWSQIRLNVGAFMHNLFRQGAFQGTKPADAYLVKCDKTTTTQNDVNLGIVNVLVGFAPLKPAEFVVIKIQQLAGQVEA